MKKTTTASNTSATTLTKGSKLPWLMAALLAVFAMACDLEVEDEEWLGQDELSVLGDDTNMCGNGLGGDVQAYSTSCRGGCECSDGDIFGIPFQGNTCGDVWSDLAGACSPCDAWTGGSIVCRDGSVYNFETDEDQGSISDQP